jgi:hypothetical protein
VTGCRWIFLGGAHDRSTLLDVYFSAIGRLGGASGTSATVGPNLNFDVAGNYCIGVTKFETDLFRVGNLNFLCWECLQQCDRIRIVCRRITGVNVMITILGFRHFSKKLVNTSVMINSRIMNQFLSPPPIFNI